MQSGRRTQLLTYLLLIAVNLLVVPNWFSPGHFSPGSRLMLAVLNIGIIAFCAWRISRILGVNPFSRSKKPTYAPYAIPREEEAAWAAERERFPRRSGARSEPADRERPHGRGDELVQDDPDDEPPAPRADEKGPPHG